MHLVPFITGIVLVSVAFPGALVLSIFTFIGSTGFGYRKRVLLHGEDATVKILSIRETYSRINYSPVVHFVMEVHPTLGNAYRLERNIYVPLIFISRIQPGEVVAAKFDPEDQEKVAFDFGRVLTPEERAAAVNSTSSFLRDLISPAEQARRTRARIGLAILYLLGAILIFALGLAMIITTALGSAI